MLSLRHPYISVQLQSGKSYGGGQQFSPNAMVRRCGCGIVAATDLLLYLSKYHLQEPVVPFAALLREDPLPFSAYNDCILWMNRHYFPMIPYNGINGLMLMAGMQKFFHDYRLPYTSRWCMAQSRLWERLEGMLREDVPVILAVGPNFPMVWGDKRVHFYRKTADGKYKPTAGAKAHFFTVTGSDESWARISSWGQMYYLNRWEFRDYARKSSIGFVNNALLIERK